MKILEEASEGNVGVWTDLPGKFIKGEMGDAIPLRLGRDTSDEGWDLNWDTIPHKNITLKAPFRLRLFPVDCARLFRAEMIEVQKFIPPQEILNQEELDIGGRDSHGLQWHVYPLWNENGILSISVEIDRNRLYVLSEGVEERNQKQSSGPRSPSQIFIHQQIASGVTDWKDAWRDIRKMADVKTSITFNDCVYVLHKKNVPHPKSDGMIDAVEFDQETEPPKTITINKYSFRDSFQRLIKKK